MEYNIQEDRVQEERRGILSKLKVPKVNVARIGRPGFVLPSFFPDIRASYSNEADEPGKKTFVIFFIKNKHRDVSSENVRCTIYLIIKKTKIIYVHFQDTVA